MAIKISASNSNAFNIIEQSLSKLDKQFIDKFEVAEYVMEGMFKDIKLSISGFSNEMIILPKGFVIEEIQNTTYSIYEKDTDGVLNEKDKYQIMIQGTFEKQIYKLIYSNLFTINKTICFK